MEPTEHDRAYLRTLTLLYVEDVPVVREFTRQVLEPLVGKLILAVDGSSGLEVFRNVRPHLVVTDIVMPDRDGLSMAKAMRDLDPKLPIIVTTAYDNTEFLVRSIDLGVEKYVFKPVVPEELRAALLRSARRLAAEEELVQKRHGEAERMRHLHYQAMHDLARGMGHDFNNLLQGILGAVSVAKLSTPPANPLHGILNLAEGSANQARELVRKLICLAKGPVPLNQASNLGPVLESSVEAGLKGTAITPVFAFPPDLPLVNFDEQDLRLVTELLLANAQEAMPSGGTFTVAASVCALGAGNELALPDGAYLRCTFQDSGAGIREDLLARIFDPYFTTKAGKTQKGVGLSLAIGQAIAHAHGGILTAESLPGEGAAFHLFLPVSSGSNPG